jgi:hypothetical protein
METSMSILWYPFSHFLGICAENKTGEIDKEAHLSVEDPVQICILMTLTSFWVPSLSYFQCRRI